MQPTARSLILDLLSTLRRDSMPVRALVEAAGILGIEENNVRVSLARLYASGRIERDERGRYRLGPAVAAISGRLRSWRDIGHSTRPWQGEWIALHRARLGRGPARRRCERALDLLGFRELETGLAVRPDNLLGGLPAVRDDLVSLSFPRSSPDSSPESASGTAPSSSGRHLLGRVFLAHDFDPTSDLEARSLWDAEVLAREAHDSLGRLHESEARLARLETEEAMSETFLVGGRVLRQLVRHPLLPREILDPVPLDALLAGMMHYDRLGRDVWARFLAKHDVTHRALPLDARRSTKDLIPADR